MTHAAEVEDRLKESGLTKISDYSCPRKLAGKRCQGKDGWRGTGLPYCWCHSSLNDHGATYRDSRGRRFVLWEPYGAFGEVLVEVIVAAHADGLRVHVDGWSPWNPGRTLAIEFRCDEEISA
jgi:hypothetical protein